MPRGAPCKVDHVRVDFIEQIKSARSLVDAVQKLEGIHPNAARSMHSKHVRRVEELAFLGVCGSWEEFLEQTFVRYLAGAKTSGGFSPKLRIGKCLTIQHAYQIISADPGYDPAKKFLPWTSPTNVIKLAELFFKDGAPFKAPLDKWKQALSLAVQVRNRVAHASEKCRADFKKAALVLLDRPNDGDLSQGFRVGDLLRSGALPKFFTKAITIPPSTVFEAYLEMYQTLSESIVPV